MKQLSMAIVVALVFVGGSYAMAQGSSQKQTEQQKFDNKSDFEKGKAQLKAQKDGKTYADPSRQKALNEAMGEPASGDKTKAKSTDTTKPK